MYFWHLTAAGYELIKQALAYKKMVDPLFSLWDEMEVKIILYRF